MKKDCYEGCYTRIYVKGVTVTNKFVVLFNFLVDSS